MATRKRSSYDAGIKLKVIVPSFVPTFNAILGVRLIDECDLYKSFVPTFNAILWVRLIDECDLYSRQYGRPTCLYQQLSVLPKLPFGLIALNYMELNLILLNNLHRRVKIFIYLFTVIYIAHFP